MMTTSQPRHQETRHVADRMAIAIVAALEQTGRCSIEDLRINGFSLAELARYWPEAWKIVEAKRPRP
jgi:hypothetical protein